MAAAVSCPDAVSLQRFLAGDLPEDLAESYVQHLSQCQRCVQTLHELKLNDTLVDALREASSATLDKPISPEAQTLIARFRRLPEQAAVAEAQTQDIDGKSDTPDGAAGTIAPAAADATNELHDFLAPPQAPDEIGQLGGYRVLGVLGAGGMGTVFLAEDPNLERRVALKVMKPSLAATRSAKDRFLREARATAKVKHDHIVTIHQVGEDRGVPFIAMELLEGETLDDRLQREEKLPVADVLHIGKEIAIGLGAAHKRGLLHRDIKPANVWLESGELVSGGVVSGEYKKPIVHGSPLMTHHSPLTTHYSPSRVKIVDFSLGCVLYRITTGQPPFRGTDSISTLVSVASDQPTPPAEIDPAIPAGVSEFIMKLLAKKPEERPASAQAVVEALQRLEREVEHDKVTRRQGDKVTDEATVPIGAPAGHPATVSPSHLVTRSSSRRWLVAAAVLLVLLPLSYFYGGTIIRIATDQGEIVIKADREAVAVTIDKQGVTLRDVKTPRKYTVKLGRKNLPSGEYEIDVTQLPADLTFSTKRFTLKRGGEVLVEVWFNPVAAGPGILEGVDPAGILDAESHGSNGCRAGTFARSDEPSRTLPERNRHGRRRPGTS